MLSKDSLYLTVQPLCNIWIASSVVIVNAILGIHELLMSSGLRHFAADAFLRCLDRRPSFHYCLDNVMSSSLSSM